MKKLSEKFFLYADRHISPFEGSPRAGAAEYVSNSPLHFSL